MKTSASYECIPPPLWGEFVTSMLTDGFLAIQFRQLGWVEPETLEHMRIAWHKWGGDPDAFFANAAGEAIGWKV